MKNILQKSSRLLIVLIIITLTTKTQPAYAMSNSSNIYIEHFEDGSYLEIQTKITPASNNSLLAVGQNKTASKTASKTYSYKNAANQLQWSATITGTFRINKGQPSYCSNLTKSYKINDSTWSLQSTNSNKTNNQAIGKFVFIQKISGIALQTQSCQIILTCDTNGNIY